MGPLKHLLRCISGCYCPSTIQMECIAYWGFSRDIVWLKKDDNKVIVTYSKDNKWLTPAHGLMLCSRNSHKHMSSE